MTFPVSMSALNTFSPRLGVNMFILRSLFISSILLGVKGPALGRRDVEAHASIPGTQPNYEMVLHDHAEVQPTEITSFSAGGSWVLTWTPPWTFLKTSILLSLTR